MKYCVLILIFDIVLKTFIFTYICGKDEGLFSKRKNSDATLAVVIRFLGERGANRKRISWNGVATSSLSLGIYGVG